MNIESITVTHIKCKNQKTFHSRIKRLTQGRRRHFDSRIVEKVETKKVEYSPKAAIEGYTYLMWRVRR